MLKPGINLIALPVLLFPYFLFYAVPNDQLKFLYVEDSFFEWAAFFAWAAASVIHVLLLKHAVENRAAMKAFWMFALAAVTFVAAGEEISWGQRVFNYETPAAIEANNLQKEMNLHNLTWFDVRDEIGGDTKTGIARWLTFNRLGTLLWLGYLVLIPAVCWFSKPIKTITNVFGTPVLTIKIAVFAVANYAVFKFFRWVSAQSPDDLLSIPINEYKETAIAILFLAGAWYLKQVGYIDDRKSSVIATEVLGNRHNGSLDS